MRTIHDRKKGQKIFCSNTDCKDLIAVFAVDVPAGTLKVVTSSLFESNQGQAPWGYRERMVCRKCGNSWRA